MLGIRPSSAEALNRNSRRRRQRHKRRALN